MNRHFSPTLSHFRRCVTATCTALFFGISLSMAAVAAEDVLDLNTATVKELQALPGVGKKLANEIIKYRQQHGNFSAVEDLIQVPGINASLLGKLIPLVEVKVEVKADKNTGMSDDDGTDDDAETPAGRDPVETATVTPKSSKKSTASAASAGGLAGQESSSQVVAKILARYAHEPTVTEVQQAAIRYARADPENIDAWRARARISGSLPELQTRVDGAFDRNLRSRTNLDATEAIVETKDDDNSYGVQMRATWDLDRLIFEPEEMSVARESVRLSNLRDRVVDEATRRYFERRRLQIEMELAPPADLGERVRKELRLMELTANLDALTGGWFSSQLNQAVGVKP